MDQTNSTQSKRKPRKAAKDKKLPENYVPQKQWPFDDDRGIFLAEARAAAQGIYSLANLLQADSNNTQILAESDEPEDEVQPMSPVDRDGFFLTLQICSHKLQASLDMLERGVINAVA